MKEPADPTARDPITREEIDGMVEFISRHSYRNTWVGEYASIRRPPRTSTEIEEDIEIAKKRANWIKHYLECE
jgi:hypothetical protein